MTAKERARKRHKAERARERREADARRRAAMFWMLREAGATYAEIARAAGLSVGRVWQICRGHAYQLHRRTEYTSEDPFMARLRRAGALLGVAERVGGAIGSGSTPVALRFEPRAGSLGTEATDPGGAAPGKSARATHAGSIA